MNVAFKPGWYQPGQISNPFIARHHFFATSTGSACNRYHNVRYGPFDESPRGQCAMCLKKLESTA